MGQSAVSPPFPYFGGKQRIASRIAAVLPAHTHYVEPFCGGLSVLLAKPASQLETVNDLDGDIMAFWRVLRDRPADLERACTLTPHSRAESVAARQADAADEVERARRVWVLLTQRRGGQLRPTGWRYNSGPTSSPFPISRYLDGYLARIAPAAERLRSVSLECLPALEVIGKYGANPAALLYVDPPYLGSVRGSTSAYRHEMKGLAAHVELAGALRGCRAAVVVSGYPCHEYEGLYDGWRRLLFRAHTAQQAGTVTHERTEAIWCNRQFAGQPALFDAAC